MPRPVPRQIGQRQLKKAHRGMQPPAVLGVLRPGGLFLEMHKSARHLNQPFKESVVGIAPPKPELFEDVVRFVIALGIEAREITEVIWIELAIRFRGETSHEGGDTVTFFHARGSSARDYPADCRA